MMPLSVVVAVLLITSFGFVKPVNGQRMITESRIKYKDCS